MVRYRLTKLWESHNLVPVVFCLASIAVWYLSINSSKFEFGDNLGLFSSLGSLYYAAVALALVPLGLACLGMHVNWKISLASLFILQAELYLSFNFMWGFSTPYPSYSPDALSYGISTQISQQGGLLGLFPSPLSWPGAWILGSLLTQITGVSDINIGSTLIVWLFLSSSLFLFFVLMYRVSKDLQVSILGGLCFVVGAWTIPAAFNDVGFAVPLVLGFLVLAFESYGKMSKRSMVATLIVVSSLVIANPYAAFSVLSILAVYSFPFFQRNVYRYWMPIFLVGVITFGLWYFLSSVNLFAAYSPLLNRLFNLGFLSGQLAAKYTGSVAHKSVILAGEGLSALLGVTSLVGVLKRRHFLGTAVGRKIVLTSVGLVLALLILGPAYALGSSIRYSVVETIARSWVFGFLFIGYFVTKLFTKRNMIVLIVLMGLLTPVFLMASSGDFGLYWSPSEVYGGVYVENHVVSAYVLKTDNFTTLDGLYCSHVSCLNNLTATKTTISLGSLNETATLSNPNGLATLLSFSSHNSYLIESITGNSSTYISEWIALPRIPAIDLIYSTDGMSVMTLLRP